VDESDLFFYDYRDFNQAIYFSSQEFLDFLNSIYPKPDPSLFEAGIEATSGILTLGRPVPRFRTGSRDMNN